MLYHGENPILQITAVEHMRWDGGRYQVMPREYSALAFRIHGTAQIQYDGGICHVNTNDILYLPQQLGYTATYSDTELLVIHFIAQQCDKRIELYAPEDSGQIYKMFLRAHTLWQNRNPVYSVYVMSQLYEILGKIYEKQTETTLPPRFLKAMSYINSSFRSSNLSIDAICAQSQICATTFRQLLKKHYGKTPIAYITDLRLEYARNLIAGGATVEKAAFQSGFNDSKYFARVVKQNFGCNPRQLRLYGK